MYHKLKPLAGYTEPGKTTSNSNEKGERLNRQKYQVKILNLIELNKYLHLMQN